MREVRAKELSIVMVGDFNPVIINPNWLVGKGLISELDAKGATEERNYITHPEVSQFNLPYCSVQTLQERYTATSTQEGYFEKLHELTTAIFNFLKETPVYRMGINTTCHYEFGSNDDWNRFGDMLAPKDAWEPLAKDPGLKRMEMRSYREDGLKGEINTTVGLSELFPLRGVKVKVNDHYDLYTQEELTDGKNINASKALEILENWEEKLRYANKLIDGIISYEKK